MPRRLVRAPVCSLGVRLLLLCTSMLCHYSSCVTYIADSCTQACGVNDAFGVDYALRVRMCKRCYEEKYTSVAFIRKGYDTNSALLVSVVDVGKALEPLPSEYREIVSNVVLMLVPSANSFSACSNPTLIRVLLRTHVICLYSDFRNPAASKDRINPLTHLMQDTYFKPELGAVLHFFWPLTEHGSITDLRPLVRTRVNYVMKRQAVSPSARSAQN